MTEELSCVNDAGRDAGDARVLQSGRSVIAVDESVAARRRKRMGEEEERNGARGGLRSVRWRRGREGDRHGVTDERIMKMNQEDDLTPGLPLRAKERETASLHRGAQVRTVS